VTGVAGAGVLKLRRLLPPPSLIGTTVMPNDVSASSNRPVKTMAGAEGASIATLPNVSTSALNGRASAATPTGPRLILAKIGQLFQGVKRVFVCAPSKAVLQARRNEALSLAQDRINDPRNGLLAALRASNGNPETIARALLDTGAALHAYQEAGGNPREVVDTIRAQLKGNPTLLRQLAIGLRGAGAAQAQALLQTPEPKFHLATTPLDSTRHEVFGRPEAEHLMMAIESAVNDLLIGEIDSTIQSGLKAVQESVYQGKLSDIAPQFHALFNAAVPAIQFGAVSAGADLQKAVDEKILRQLHDTVDRNCLPRVLRYISREDLIRVRTGLPDTSAAAGTAAGGENAAPGVESPFQPDFIRAVELEYTGRITDSQDELKRLMGAYVHSAKSGDSGAAGRATSVDPGQFVRDVVAMAKNSAEILGSNPRVNLGTLDEAPVPDFQPVVPVLEALQDSFSSAQVLALTPALRTLNFGTEAKTVLGPAQIAILKGQRTNFAERLSGALGSLADRTHPDQALRDLRDLSRAYHALLETASTFGLSSAGDDVLENVIDALSSQDTEQLVAALGDPQRKALVEALRTGAQLAGVTDEKALQKEFSDMAAMLEELARRLDVGDTDESSSSQSAASPPATLSDGWRTALRDVFGLDLPEEGLHWLNAGQFTPAHTQRLARELALTASEKRLETVAGQEIGSSFADDVRRARPFQIVDPHTTVVHPLVDRSDWPTDPAERDQRIAAGFKELVQLCDGNREQAQRLTQRVNPWLWDAAFRSCVGDDSPIRLPDGTRGRGLRPGPDPGKYVESEVFTFSRNQNGRPQVDVDYRVSGSMRFRPIAGPAVPLTADSHMEIRFSFELLENGEIALLGTPTYNRYLQPEGDAAEASLA